MSLDNVSDRNIQASVGLARAGEPISISLTEYLENLRQRVHTAPESIRHDASQLIMKYLESDDEGSSSRLLHAIEALLNEEESANGPG